MNLLFSDLDALVRLDGCDEMTGLIMPILCGWNVDIAKGEHDDTPPVMTIRKTDRGYERTASWLDKPAAFRDPVDAACDFAADLIRLHTNESEILCLHAGAVQFPDGLMVFPDTHRRGKSVISGLLAQAGYWLFSDDVVPIEKNGTNGEAIGILPRVRIPLPDTLSPDFRDFIDQTAVIRNNRYCYFGHCDKTAAPKGAQAPIMAIIMLERDVGKTPLLQEAKKSDTLARLIKQNFGHGVPASDALDQLHQIVMGAECLSLHYDEGEDTIPMLTERFGAGT